MLGPSSSVVSSPKRYHTPIPSEAGAIEAASACSAPGPIEVTTAAFSPVDPAQGRGGVRGLDLAAHAAHAHQPGLLIDAQHLADLCGTVAEHAEKDAHPLAQQAQDDGFRQGRVDVPGQGARRQRLLQAARAGDGLRTLAPGPSSLLLGRGCRKRFMGLTSLAADRGSARASTSVLTGADWNATTCPSARQHTTVPPRGQTHPHPRSTSSWTAACCARSA